MRRKKRFKVIPGIATDLKGSKFEELQADYYQAYQINELKLRPMLYCWTTKDVEKMLLKTGFQSFRTRTRARRYSSAPQGRRD
jgi:hypothetical protein